MAANPKPLVCIAASLMEVANGRFKAHGTSSVVVNSTATHAACMPFLVPGLGSQLDIDDLVSRIDGLVLPGGRANVEPHHFNGAPFPDEEPIDPGRDNTVLPLIRTCIRQRVPIFGICRGIQEMNVAMGGSLHYRVHLLDGKDDHRMPRHDDVTVEEIFKLRHTISLSGSLAEIAGADELAVNSLHGQAVDQIAGAFAVEAMSPDGVIEGIRLKGDRTFTVGVQWHAEWEPQNHDFSRRLFEAFGEAARQRAYERDRHKTPIAV